MLNKHFKSKKAFTLVEFIIVMAIIGILVLLASPKFLDYVNKAKLTQIKNDVKVVENWNKAYYADNLKLPTDKEVSYQSILIHINKLNNYNNESTNIAKNNFVKTIYANDGIEQDFKTQLYFYDERGLITNTNLIEGDKFYLLDKEEVVKNTNTKLKGFFITNNKGDVFYTDDKNYINNKENIDLGLCRYDDLLQYKGKDYKVDDNGYITYFNKDNYIKQKDGIFEVPGVINGTIVKGIADGTSTIEGSNMTFNGVFSGLDIRELKLPCTLEYIGSFAFAQNRIIKLNTNNTPNLKEIQEGTFQDNPIKELTVSENIEFLGKNSFYNSKDPDNKDLNITINKPDSQTVVGNYNTKNNDDLTIHNDAFGTNNIKSNNKSQIIGINNQKPNYKPNYNITTNKDNTVSISNYTGNKKKVVIPNTINGKVVTEIKENTFKGKGLEEVILPNGLKNIGDYAFAFNILKEVNIPKNINSVGNYAFAYNTDIFDYTKPTIQKSIIIEDIIKYNDGIDKETGNINKKLNTEKQIIFKEGIFKIYDKDANIIDLNDLDINKDKDKDKDKELNKYTIKQVALGSSHSAVITENGVLYTWGAGYDGTLGHGDQITQSTPKKVDYFINNNIKIKQVVWGGNHSAAITEDGDLYTWGRNYNNQLGLGDTNNRNTPTKITGISNVKQVVLGSSHSAVITENGVLYTWGYGDHGRLGHGDQITQSTPKKVNYFINNNIKIKQVALGDYHSAAITEDGDLYTWGYNYYSQLGDGTTTDRSKPVKVNIPKVVQVALGNTHSAAITKNGELYTWGRNNYGQLGDKTTTNRSKPVKVDILKVDQVALGNYYSAALTNDGKLYTWGYNYYGQLGHGDTNNRNTPTKVTGISNVKQVVLGSSHSAAITEDGKLYTWGYGKYGRLGHNNEDNQSIPKKVEFFNNQKENISTD